MNTPAIDELFSFSQDAQKAWFNAQQEAKFQAALLECPIVAISVDIRHAFDELLESLPDYNHGLQFIHSGLVAEDRIAQLEGGSALNEEEQIKLKEFLLTELVHDEIFDNKITEARWLEVETNGAQLGAVFIGTNHPLMESKFDFLGLFKHQEDVKNRLKDFGELIDPKNYY